MAEEKTEVRDSWRTLAPFTELFRAFQIALDLNKLLLAAGGIVTMTLGWSILSLVFAAGYDKTAPIWSQSEEKSRTAQDYAEHREKRQAWNLMHEAAGVGSRDERYAVEDFAETLEEYQKVEKLLANFDPLQSEKSAPQIFREHIMGEISKLAPAQKTERAKLEAMAPHAVRYGDLGKIKPHARLSVWPWFEDRGPNPYLLVTGQTGLPWQPGFFWDWFSRDQVPVMIEPLIKFVRPIVYFLSPYNTFISKVYFLLAALVMLVTWSIFGGAITRIAAVQYATKGERIGVTEALKFTFKRLVDYVLAPLFPLGFVFMLVIFSAFPYFIGMIPVVGDLFAGLFWPLWLTFGLIMAVALVGLVGWPLMAATISTEGTDSWEAVSRTYSYVYQRPWHFVWYALVSVAYGGAVVFFIGFMGSFAVYLAKWGASNTPGAGYFNREPAFLFVYAPTSFGWRELLLEGVKSPEKADPANKEKKLPGRDVVEPRSTQREGGMNAGQWNRIDPVAFSEYKESLAWWNHLGAGLVGFWLSLAFLLVLGFGYSFFWTASTIIYFLLRKSVDTNELDDVFLEEEEQASKPAMPPPSPATPTSPVEPRTTLPLVPPSSAPAPSSTDTPVDTSKPPVP